MVKCSGQIPAVKCGQIHPTYQKSTTRLWDTAVTADGVGKSLTAAAVVREHGGSGAGSLAEIDFRPSPRSTASGGGREAASDQR